MTNIDPAIVEAAGRKPAFDRWAEQAGAPIAAKIDKYVPAFAAPALYQAIAAAVDAARAEAWDEGYATCLGDFDIAARRESRSPNPHKATP